MSTEVITMSAIKSLALAVALLVSLILPAPERTDFERYRARVEGVRYVEDIEANGFIVLEDHSFQAEFESFGSVSVLTALDPKHGRLILFLTGADGRVVYQTDELECNHIRRGELNQPNVGVSAIAFRDINHDDLKDIVLISRCAGPAGLNTGDTYRDTYKVGDVLFQSDTGLYRDWRLSDKLNRFDMNTNLDVVTAFARDGDSVEFLYSAATLRELIRNGFQIEDDRDVSFERFGEVRMISGDYRLAGYYILMIYLVDPNGNVAWRFQPMGGYPNFNRIRGFLLTDLDGDGLTDLLGLIRYDTFDKNHNTIRVTDYVIYYQRNGYFEADTAFQSSYVYADGDEISDVAERAAAFWRSQ